MASKAKNPPDRRSSSHRSQSAKITIPGSKVVGSTSSTHDLRKANANKQSQSPKTQWREKHDAETRKKLKEKDKQIEKLRKENIELKRKCSNCNCKGIKSNLKSPKSTLNTKTKLTMAMRNRNNDNKSTNDSKNTDNINSNIDNNNINNDKISKLEKELNEYKILLSKKNDELNETKLLLLASNVKNNELKENEKSVDSVNSSSICEKAFNKVCSENIELQKENQKYRKHEKLEKLFSNNENEIFRFCNLNQIKPNVNFPLIGDILEFMNKIYVNSYQKVFDAMTEWFNENMELKIEKTNDDSSKKKKKQQQQQQQSRHSDSDSEDDDEYNEDFEFVFIKEIRCILFNILHLCVLKMKGKKIDFIELFPKAFQHTLWRAMQPWIKENYKRFVQCNIDKINKMFIDRNNNNMTMKTRKRNQNDTSKEMDNEFEIFYCIDNIILSILKKLNEKHSSLLANTNIRMVLIEYIENCCQFGWILTLHHPSLFLYPLNFVGQFSSLSDNNNIDNNNESIEISRKNGVLEDRESTLLKMKRENEWEERRNFEEKYGYNIFDDQRMEECNESDDDGDDDDDDDHDSEEDDNDNDKDQHQDGDQDDTKKVVYVVWPSLFVPPRIGMSKDTIKQKNKSTVYTCSNKQSKRIVSLMKSKLILKENEKETNKQFSTMIPFRAVNQILQKDESQDWQLINNGEELSDSDVAGETPITTK